MDKVQTIIDLTSEHFGISEKLMTMKSYTKGAKIREVVNARMVAMVMIGKYTGMSLKSIGRRFGGRDHTTVIHAQRTVPDLCDTIRQFKADFKFLDKKIALKLDPEIDMQKRFEENGYAYI